MLTSATTTKHGIAAGCFAAAVGGLLLVQGALGAPPWRSQVQRALQGLLDVSERGSGGTHGPGGRHAAAARAGAARGLCAVLGVPVMLPGLEGVLLPRGGGGVLWLVEGGEHVAPSAVVRSAIQVHCCVCVYVC